MYNNYYSTWLNFGEKKLTRCFDSLFDVLTRKQKMTTNLLLLPFEARIWPDFVLLTKQTTWHSCCRNPEVGNGRNFRVSNDLLYWDFEQTFSHLNSGSDQFVDPGKILADSLCLVFLGRTVLNKTKFFKDNFYWEKAWVSSKAKFQLIKICLQKREVS